MSVGGEGWGIGVRGGTRRARATAGAVCCLPALPAGAACAQQRAGSEGRRGGGARHPRRSVSSAAGARPLGNASSRGACCRCRLPPSAHRPFPLSSLQLDPVPTEHRVARVRRAARSSPDSPLIGAPSIPTQPRLPRALLPQGRRHRRPGQGVHRPGGRLHQQVFGRVGRGRRRQGERAWREVCGRASCGAGSPPPRLSPPCPRGLEQGLTQLAVGAAVGERSRVGRVGRGRPAPFPPGAARALPFRFRSHPCPTRLPLAPLNSVRLPPHQRQRHRAGGAGERREERGEIKGREHTSAKTKNQRPLFPSPLRPPPCCSSLARCRPGSRRWA